MIKKLLIISLLIVQIIGGMQQGQGLWKPVVFERPRDLICTHIEASPRTLADDTTNAYVAEEQKDPILRELQNLKLYHLQHPVMRGIVKTTLKYTLLNHNRLWRKQRSRIDDESLNAYLSEVLARGSQQFANRINKYCRPIFFLKDLANLHAKIDQEFNIASCYRQGLADFDSDESKSKCSLLVLLSYFDKICAKELEASNGQLLASKPLIKYLYERFDIMSLRP